MLKNVVLCVVSFGVLAGQTQVDLKSQSKRVDFTTATATKPMKSGTALPGVCSIGEFFFNTNAPAGANVYACTAPNIWSLEGGQGFLSGAQPPSGGCSVGQVYVDTANGNSWFCETPGTWQKVLSTTNVGAFVITGQNGSTPSSPSSGNTSLFFSTTAKAGQSVDDAGNLATMVRVTDCSSSGRVIQRINSDGTVTCANAGGPVTYSFPGGAGSNASPQPGLWWTDGGTSVICPAGTPFQCSLHWNSGSNILAITTVVPKLWAGGTVSVALRYQGSGSNNTVQASVSSGCANNGGAFAFNSSQNFSSQATSGNNYYVTSLPALTMAGCLADNLMVLKFGRLDSAGFLNLAEASVTFNLP